MSPSFYFIPMAKFKELIWGVIEDLKGYNVTDDNLLSEDIIAAKMNNIRVTLLGQETMLVESYYQHYPCLEVKCEKDQCTYNGITVKGKKIYYVDAPEIVGSLGRVAIKYLGDSEYKDRYSEVDITQFDKIGAMPYGTHKRYFARIGNRIFLNGLDLDVGKMLTLVAIFYDPRCVLDCFHGEDVEYPVPSEYKLQLMTKKDVLSSYGIPSDVLNNAADDQPKQQEK